MIKKNGISIFKNKLSKNILAVLHVAPQHLEKPAPGENQDLRSWCVATDKGPSLQLLRQWPEPEMCDINV